MSKQNKLGMLLGVAIFSLFFQFQRAGAEEIDIADAGVGLTWSKNTSGLVFDKMLVIDNGETLTIEAGTAITFTVNPNDPFASPGISVRNGKLVVNGTSAEKVTFTSSEDGFNFSFSDNTNESVINHAKFQNGGFIPTTEGAGGDLVPHYPVFQIDGGKVRLENSQFVGSRSSEMNISDLPKTDADGNFVYDADGNQVYNNVQVGVTNSIFYFQEALNSGLNCLWIYDEATDSEYIDPECLKRVTLKNNWYGHPDGPTTDEDENQGIVKGFRIFGTYFLDGWRATDAIVESTADGASNVLFLPGLEASRLFKDGILGSENQLWEPNRDGDVEKLFLDENGKSVNEDIYTDSVIDEVNLSPIAQSNIYKSFLSDLGKWKNEEKIINDYAIAPYDWRLTLDDILDGGGVTDGGHIYYTGQSIDPYIIKKLRELAASSKSGKVTIVAHSNGGLLAKALVKRLGSEAEGLIDKIVLVAVPQSGTPQAIGGLLNGFEQGLPKDWLPFFLSPGVARELASNMPSAYHLLPSGAYFNGQGSEVSTPPITFKDGALTQKWIESYGQEIGSFDELTNFFQDSEQKVAVDSNNLTSPISINTNLLDYGRNIHDALDDNWTPPASISIFQIAGFGEETLSGMEYWTGKECVAVDRGYCIGYQDKIQFTPKTMIDGDGTVVAPSALAMESVSRYWVDLKEYNKHNINREHADILEVDGTREFIKSNVLVQANSVLPDYISNSKPAYDGSIKRLQYILHSPLALSIKDSSGNEVSAKVSNIPDANFKRFGEVQFVSLPEGVPHTVFLDGIGEGSFTLEAREVEGENVASVVTFAGIPTTPETQVEMIVSSGTLESAAALIVDYNGDNVTDFSLEPKIGETVSLPPLDQTPPEAKIQFNPETQKLEIIGVYDVSQNVSVVLTEIPSVQSRDFFHDDKEREREYNDDEDGRKKGNKTIATAVLADEAENTTKLVLEKTKDKNGHLSIAVKSITYNDVETKISKASLQYKWRLDRGGKYKLFASSLRSETTTSESHYILKKNQTWLMEKPRELKDDERDDESEWRPVRKKLPGMVVPALETKAGKINIIY